MSEENTVTVPEEEAADFARVEAMAGAAEVPVVPVPEAVAEAEAEAPRMDAAESLAGLLAMVSSVASIAGMKRTAAVWSPEVCREGAARAVPVLRKYPWGFRVIEFFETGAGVEEIALCAFLLPVGLATWQAVKADLTPLEEAKPAEQPAATGGAVAARDAMPQTGAMVEVTGRAD